MLNYLQNPSKQEILSEFFDSETIEHIFLADPTPKKSYVLWLGDNLRQLQQCYFPVPLSVIRRILTWFDQNKQNLEPKQRDIGKYNIFSLKDLYYEYKPTVRTELSEIILHKDSKILYKDKDYLIIKCPSIASVIYESQGTVWCTRKSKDTRNYLKMGSIYVIYDLKNNAKYIFFLSKLYSEFLDIEDDERKAYFKTYLGDIFGKILNAENLKYLKAYLA